MYKTIREILESVNTSIQSMVGQKQDADDFHYNVGRLANKYCKREGVDCCTWKLKLHNDYYEIADLKLERLDDKRTKWNPIWKNLSLEFVVTDENILDLTVEETKAYFERKNVENRIKGLELSIAEAYEEIEQMKVQQKELEEKLKGMK